MRATGSCIALGDWPAAFRSVLATGDWAGQRGAAETTVAAGRTDESRPPQTEREIETRRRAIRRAMRIGLWVWPCFTLLDLYMGLVLYPGAPLVLFLGYRALIEALLIAVYQATLRPRVSLGLVARAQDTSFFLAAFCIGLMAVHLGGIRSAYMHGISIVLLVRAAVIAEPWRRSLITFVPIGLTYPVVMTAVAAWSPEARREWLNLASLQVFAGNYVFVVASSLVGMASGHAVWAAQQQVYRARRLGRYRLQAPIGQGGMGEVWLAWDESLRRNLALKLLRVSGSSDPGLVRRFEREAFAASQLRVPHTIQIYDFGASDDGIYYIAMEYLSGVDLHALVREHGPLPAARVVHLALQACRSLEEAHAAGIIHRDIKPQNLFVTQVGEERDFLKLLDFGVARIQEAENHPQVTLPGRLTGTPAFMAPELWQGATADARSDIYALGATLYYLLTGAAPFEATGLDECRQAHVQHEPIRPSLRRGETVPAPLEAIILRCLAKAPAQRYPSVRELRAALESL